MEQHEAYWKALECEASKLSELWGAIFPQEPLCERDFLMLMLAYENSYDRPTIWHSIAQLAVEGMREDLANEQWAWSLALLDKLSEQKA